MINFKPEDFINDTVSAMQPSGIRKFFDIVNQMSDAISLGVGEPDFSTPWHIRECAIESLERGYTTYTSNQGMLPLRNAIANYLKEKIGVSFWTVDTVEDVKRLFDLGVRYIETDILAK